MSETITTAFPLIIPIKEEEPTTEARLLVEEVRYIFFSFLNIHII
jgi:hypothetical protein